MSGKHQIITEPSRSPMDSRNSYRMKDIWRKTRKKGDAAKAVQIVTNGVSATIMACMTGKGTA